MITDYEMESKSIEEVLNIVKEILATTPSVAKDTSTVLPEHIPALPQWSTSLPENEIPLKRSIERLTADVLPYLNASSLSPHYYGFVTGGATPAALIADILTSIYDQNVAVHLPMETIATNVEVVALNMLLDLLNLSWRVGTEGSAGGIFTTGATASNVLGLALGREFVLEAFAQRATGKSVSVGEDGLLAVARAAQVDQVKVLSTLPHSSIAKAASVVGLGRSCVLSIAKEGTPLTIDLEKLESLAEDAEADRTAYILAISTGEVNTGHYASDSAEMMQKVRSICDRYKIWMHVDGAFGLFSRVLMGHSQAHEYKDIIDGVQGVELADSITADGHKLLNVPYDCGIFFTRHKHLSEATFMNGNAAYLSSGPGSDSIQSPLNIGIENSRRFRALPVYHTLSAYGRQGYCEMLMRQIQLARRIAGWIWDHPKYDLLPTAATKEVALSKVFMIVLFRAKNTEVNEKLVKSIKDTRKIYVSGTSWDGQPAARVAISNWQVNPDADAEIVESILETVV